MVYKVSQFNKMQLVKYSDACNKWDANKGGFPSRSMYVFQTTEGSDRKRGFVVSNGHCHTFFLTRVALMKMHGDLAEVTQVSI